MLFRVMTAQSGDERHEFETADPVALKQAKAMFDDLVKNQKNIAAKKKPDGGSELIRSFDPTAEQVVFHRPLQGG